MKKLSVLLSVMMFVCCSVFAQDATKMQQPPSPASPPMPMHKMNEAIFMQQGKMMMIKDGKLVAMDKEMTLVNGTKVMTDGTVMMKDGTKKTMKNGDRITMDGKMIEGRTTVAPPQPMEKK